MNFSPPSRGADKLYRAETGVEAASARGAEHQARIQLHSSFSQHSYFPTVRMTSSNNIRSK